MLQKSNVNHYLAASFSSLPLYPCSPNLRPFLDACLFTLAFLPSVAPYIRALIRMLFNPILRLPNTHLSLAILVIVLLKCIPVTQAAFIKVSPTKDWQCWTWSGNEVKANPNALPSPLQAEGVTVMYTHAKRSLLLCSI